MYIIVSNNSKIPPDIKESGSQFEQWSVDEFLDRATSEEGIDLDETTIIYYDISHLTSQIYEGLKPFAESGYKIEYYRWDDKPNVDFTMTDKVKIFNTEEKKPEPEPVSAPVEEPQVTPTPVMETPTEVKQPEPQMTPPPVPDYPTSVLTEKDYQETFNNPNAQPQVSSQTPSQTPPPFIDPAQTNQYGNNGGFNQVPPYEQPNINPQMPYQQPQQQPTGNGSGQLYGYQAPYQQPQPQSQPYQAPEISEGVKLVGEKPTHNPHGDIFKENLSNMLIYDDYDAKSSIANGSSAKVILFGSSKGGTGKTFTCLISAYWYAKTHPTQRVAVADFDIIDGQVGITINKIGITMQNYYVLYKGGQRDFKYLHNSAVKSDHFSPNIEFYLAPSQDIPEITNNTEFWANVFELLCKNYDVVFFDTGIDYLGKKPISMLYKIANKIIITCNPSINSVKSVIKQFKSLSGERVNNVFRKSENILDRVNIVLTRVYEDADLNDVVVMNLSKYAQIIAAFGNIDNIVSRVQWYQDWQLIDSNADITESLNEIVRF